MNKLWLVIGALLVTAGIVAAVASARVAASGTGEQDLLNNPEYRNA